MNKKSAISQDEVRALFCEQLSIMYQKEVPAYKELLNIVALVNHEFLMQNSALKKILSDDDNLERINDERHGAIRLGKSDELFQIGRLFRIMGMLPVGYYDLSVAGIPVHSTAFRAIDKKALSKNPFRVFTSLLRLELIDDKITRTQAKTILDQRTIITPNLKKMIDEIEKTHIIPPTMLDEFLNECIHIFQWHDNAVVDFELYDLLHKKHPLIADVVAFAGPHINHLTPRTLDIEKVQQLMPQYNITPKAIIEGPPKRTCPILLRQTSFKALNEKIYFPSDQGRLQGEHTARFGEIEQRGIALTPKGRTLYDQILNQVREKITPNGDGSNAQQYYTILNECFKQLPDDEARLRKEKLGYFYYSAQDKIDKNRLKTTTLDELIKENEIVATPIVYEDFLPVSAAGIFQSNLGDHAAHDFSQQANREQFEKALGAKIFDEFAIYQALEDQSLATIYH